MERVLHHDRSAWILGSIMLATLALVPLAASADQVPMEFAFSAVGAETDPTGLFTREEVAEGGSQVQSSVWYSTTPVDGGRMTLAILVDQCLDEILQH